MAMEVNEEELDLDVADDPEFDEEFNRSDDEPGKKDESKKEKPDDKEDAGAGKEKKPDEEEDGDAGSDDDDDEDSAGDAGSDDAGEDEGDDAGQDDKDKGTGDDKDRGTADRKQDKSDGDGERQGGKSGAGDGDKDFQALLTEKFEYPESVKVNGEDVEIKTILEDFPEMDAATTIKGFQIAERVVGNALDVIDEYIMEKVGLLKDEIGELKRELAIARKHEDFQDVVNDKKFKTWIEGQTKLVKDKAVSRDPADVIAVLDEFRKEHTRSEKKDNFDKLHGSTIRGRGKAVPQGKRSKDSDPEKEFDEEFFKE